MWIVGCSFYWVGCGCQGLRALDAAVLGSGQPINAAWAQKWDAGVLLKRRLAKQALIVFQLPLGELGF